MTVGMTVGLKMEPNGHSTVVWGFFWSKPNGYSVVKYTMKNSLPLLLLLAVIYKILTISKLSKLFLTQMMQLANFIWDSWV